MFIDTFEFEALAHTFVPTEFLIKWTTLPWEADEAFRLRRAVFCVEQGLFPGDDRDDVDAGTRSLFDYNRGMTLLRLGRTEGARTALAQARLIMKARAEAAEPMRYNVRGKNLADRIRATSPAA